MAIGLNIVHAPTIDMQEGYAFLLPIEYPLH